MPDVQETIGTMGEMLSKANLSWERMLYAAVILVAGIVIIRVLLMLADRMLKRSRLDASIKRVLRGVIKFVLGFVLCITVLAYLKVEVTSLVALLSVAALAASLALQNLLSNVAGGLMLLSTKPYAIGDYIEAGGVAGTVMETGMFYTRLCTYDNKTVQIPNSQISAEKIINYSSEENRRVDIKFRIPYHEPVEKVKGAVMQVLEALPAILSDPAPEVRVNGFEQSAIEYFIRVWCRNADYWDVYFDVLEGVKAQFDREGISMAYNQLTVQIPGKDK